MGAPSILNPTGNPHAVFRYNSGGQSQGSPSHPYKGGAKRPLMRAKCRCGAELMGQEEIEEHEALARSWKGEPQ